MIMNMMMTEKLLVEHHEKKNMNINQEQQLGLTRFSQIDILKINYKVYIQGTGAIDEETGQKDRGQEDFRKSRSSKSI